MVILSWQCPRNCRDTATCDCDNLERAIERNAAESDARYLASGEYAERIRRIARCARHFLRCYDEFPDDPSCCQEHLDALGRAVDGSPPVRYDQEY